MASREALGGHLADREWMTRVLDETHARMDELANIQRYPFPVDCGGPPHPRSPARSRIHAQATPSGAAPRCPHPRPHPGGGASGRRRRGVGAVALDRASGRTVRVEAAAVVLAAGGCAFQSKTLGCDVNTGDGALMAVEAGAALSGMEFSNAYAIAVKGYLADQDAYYSWATFYRADKTVLEGAGSTKGRPLSPRPCCPNRSSHGSTGPTDGEQRAMRKGQPDFFLSFDRQGINPFTDFFEITLRPRAPSAVTGGVRIVDYGCVHRRARPLRRAANGDTRIDLRRLHGRRAATTRHGRHLGSWRQAAAASRCAGAVPAPGLRLVGGAASVRVARSVSGTARLVAGGPASSIAWTT